MAPTAKPEGLQPKMQNDWSKMFGQKMTGQKNDLFVEEAAIPLSRGTPQITRRGTEWQEIPPP
jgi:hypothetical protein